VQAAGTANLDCSVLLHQKMLLTVTLSTIYRRSSFLFRVNRLMSTSKMSNPRVGVGCIVFNQEGRIIMGKRKGSHGAGK
jgi:hypothetical protein